MKYLQIENVSTLKTPGSNHSIYPPAKSGIGGRKNSSLWKNLSPQIFFL